MANMDLEDFYAGFGTIRFGIDQDAILALFKKDEAMQEIVDTIVQEGNEELLIREADLYFFDGSKADNTALFEIGFQFSEFCEKKASSEPSILSFDMMAESSAVLGKLFFVGDRTAIKARLERLY